jgi:hypothetical protein
LRSILIFDLPAAQRFAVDLAAHFGRHRGDQKQCGARLQKSPPMFLTSGRDDSDGGAPDGMMMQ